MWKKYWKFNDWVFEKVIGEKVDSMEEWKEIPKRWRRLKKEPIKYIRTTGQEERAGTRERGREQRMTDLQQEMFRRYKENRDFEQATGSYRV